LTLLALGVTEPATQARRPGDQCALNSECADPLVCKDGRCRQECAEDRDCPVGLNLVCTMRPQKDAAGRPTGKQYGKCVSAAPAGAPCVNPTDCMSRSCTAGTCR
jgi:hypothetical protein